MPIWGGSYGREQWIEFNGLEMCPYGAKIANVVRSCIESYIDLGYGTAQPACGGPITVLLCYLVC
jgi:hypothetical protein